MKLLLEVGSPYLSYARLHTRWARAQVLRQGGATGAGVGDMETVDVDKLLPYPKGNHPFWLPSSQGG